MNLKEHALNEFKYAKWLKDDGQYVNEMQEEICKNILELLECFAKQGHSGTTAPYCLGIFNTLAKFESIGPLTGEDWEWGEPFDNDGTRQNKRDSEVFMNKDGEAYWIHGKIFRDKDGCTYTSKDSHVPVKFPWHKPKPEIIDVEVQFIRDLLEIY